MVHNVYRFADKATVLQKAADYLNSQLATPVDTLLLLSGGSALQLFDMIDARYLTSKLTITVLDERYSADPMINNFAQLASFAAYQKADSQGVSFIDTRVMTDETQEQLAARFEEGLKRWKNTFPTGRIIATIGMGPDGHVSGMMPYPEDPQAFTTLFEDPDYWVAAYDAGDKNPYHQRVTTTMPFMRMIDTAIGFITGADKQPAFNRFLAETGTLPETPVRILKEMPSVAIFTDLT